MFSRYLGENRRVYRGAKLASTSLALGARLLINEASTVLSAEVERLLQCSARLLWTLSFRLNYLRGNVLVGMSSQLDVTIGHWNVLLLVYSTYRSPTSAPYAGQRAAISWGRNAVGLRTGKKCRSRED